VEKATAKAAMVTADFVHLVPTKPKTNYRITAKIANTKVFKKNFGHQTKTRRQSFAPNVVGQTVFGQEKNRDSL
jgi:hypothetical protein